MNIFHNLLSRNSTEKETFFENNSSFTYDGIVYEMKNILKMAQLLPVKEYNLTVLEPIFKNMKIEVRDLDIFGIALFIDHIITSKLEYCIILEDQNKHECIYGYEYIINQLMKNKKTFAVKTITTELLHQIYLKQKFNKTQVSSNPK